MENELPDLNMTHEELKREIQLGLDELDRGEVVDGPEYLEQVLKRLRFDYEAGSKSDGDLFKNDDGPASVP